MPAVNVRKYGLAPFKVAVLHGGPGASGEMAPVAEELSIDRGVLEPLQTATSVNGQVEELRFVLERDGAWPITLVGFSWGAWLGYMFAARFPALLKKLILVGSGPFEASYAEGIMETRYSRLSDGDRDKTRKLLDELAKPRSESPEVLEKLGKLISKADAFDAVPGVKERIELRQDIFQAVWPEANDLRATGKLLHFGESIQCPVVAIHGDYDPHPAKGVTEPLSKILKDFKFILLEKCGHKPWIEREAKVKFFEALKSQLE